MSLFTLLNSEDVDGWTEDRYKGLVLALECPGLVFLDSLMGEMISALMGSELVEVVDANGTSSRLGRRRRHRQRVERAGT